MFINNEISNEKIKVSISEIEVNELEKLTGFQFDWENEIDFEVFKLYSKKSNEIHGLISIARIFEELRIEIRLIELSKVNIGSKRKFSRIAGILIAFACKEAFSNGFYGFVSLIPKTRLIEHYQNKYGFIQFGKHLAVELKSSENLMNKYLSND